MLWDGCTRVCESDDTNRFFLKNYHFVSNYSLPIKQNTIVGRLPLSSPSAAAFPRRPPLLPLSAPLPKAQPVSSPLGVGIVIEGGSNLGQK